MTTNDFIYVPQNPKPYEHIWHGERNGTQYLDEKYCYPGSHVRLIRAGFSRYGNPKFQVELVNALTQQTATATNALSLPIARRRGLHLRHWDHVLARAGVLIQHPFKPKQRIQAIDTPRHRNLKLVGETGIVIEISCTNVIVQMDNMKYFRHFYLDEIKVIAEHNHD